MKNDETPLVYPPGHDILIINFAGDKSAVAVPYCEVANGKILLADGKEIVLALPNGEKTSLSHEEFVGVIRKTYEPTGLVALALKLADCPEIVKLLPVG